MKNINNWLYIMTSKVVGEGTYGCVLKPPLKCEETANLLNQDYANKISKIMSSLSLTLHISII